MQLVQQDFSHGHFTNMHNHLALHCLKVLQKIKQEMLCNHTISNQTKKIAIEIATKV